MIRLKCTQNAVASSTVTAKHYKCNFHSVQIHLKHRYPADICVIYTSPHLRGVHSVHDYGEANINTLAQLGWRMRVK